MARTAVGRMAARQNTSVVSGQQYLIVVGDEAFASATVVAG